MPVFPGIRQDATEKKSLATSGVDFATTNGVPKSPILFSGDGIQPRDAFARSREQESEP
jgi:hypothetical protein